MKRTLGFCLLLLLFASFLPAQDKITEPELIDEIGRANNESWSARLDIFLNYLSSDPDAVGLIRTYGPTGKGVGTADSIGKQAKGYLLHHGGIDEQRIKVVNGGRFERPVDTMTEFWVLPRNSEVPPQRKAFVSPIGTVTGKVAEEAVAEYFGFAVYGHETAWGPDFAVEAGIADILSSQPASRLFLVVRDAQYRIPGRWKRLVDEKLRNLEQRGIMAARIQSIYAGEKPRSENEEYGSDEIEIEYWVQNEETPPVSAVAPRKFQARAFDLADYYSLPDANEEERLLQAIADTLNEFPAFKVSFVVRRPGNLETIEGRENKEVLGLPQRLEDLLTRSGLKTSRIGREEIAVGENDSLYVHIVLHPKDESPMDSLDI
ncbi:MAG: hypothetical protein IPM63_08190 [Acidobacteriota bacterium]|nr:MAG: hypothetical protein IPM63_08190 [Acidobacteriota bacterium]